MKGEKHDEVLSVVEGRTEFFSSLLVWCLRNSFKNSKMMALAEVELKSPFVPLCQRGSFLCGISNPSFPKEGKGRFFRTE